MTTGTSEPNGHAAQNTLNGQGYIHGTDGASCSHEYLLPSVLRVIEPLRRQGKTRLFELGCGSGYVAYQLSRMGLEVTAIDPSSDGIAKANATYPEIRCFQRSSEDDLVGEFGQHSVVLSLEVVEHVYLPRTFANAVYSLLEPGGMAIISTPYHGYLKNLALALSGKMDQHFTALWDYGHIKFWSMATLSTLLVEAGFEKPYFLRVGRIPPLAKSMIAVARKPG